MLENTNKNTNPFKIPENYFENFADEIMDKLPAKEVIPATRKVSLWKKVLPWTAVAAIFCGIMITTGVLRNDTASFSSASEVSSVEEDYYLFLEDEVNKHEYKEMIYANY